MFKVKTSAMIRPESVPRVGATFMYHGVTRPQDYNIYAWCTSDGPVPGVPYHQYGTSLQVLDSYAYSSLYIVKEPAHRKRRLLLVIE